MNPQLNQQKPPQLQKPAPLVPPRQLNSPAFPNSATKKNVASKMTNPGGKPMNTQQLTAWGRKNYPGQFTGYSQTSKITPIQ